MAVQDVAEIARRLFACPVVRGSRRTRSRRSSASPDGQQIVLRPIVNWVSLTRPVISTRNTSACSPFEEELAGIGLFRIRHGPSDAFGGFGAFGDPTDPISAEA